MPELIKNSDTQKVQNAPTANVIEYPSKSPNISGAVVIISGRYPEKGYVRNNECSELAYIIKGNGKLITPNNTFTFEQQDIIITQKGEKYAWQGNFTMILVSTPKWTPEQHEEIED